jgi:acyl-CoA synthetase (AMP-forming)/AMP-acid ligase II
MLLHDPFDFQARENPHVPFAVFGEVTTTHGEAAEDVNCLANAFAAAGIKPGERIAVLSKNCLEYPIIYFAASKAGGVVVPLNYRLAPPEWAYIIADAQATAIFVAPEFLNAIDGIRGAIPTVRHFIAVGAPGTAGWDDYRSLLDAQPATPPVCDVSEDDDCYQMYTSGTTGKPKGAVLTHRAVTANMMQVAIAAASQLNGTIGDRWLIVAPVYHAAAAVTTFCCVYFGGTQYIMADFNPVEVVRVLSEERIAMATLVPAMIQACLVYVPDVAQRRYDDLRLISYGASPIAEPTLRRAMEIFACDFAQGYGMTETTAVLSYLLARDHERALREKPALLQSAGRPVPGTEIRIVDDHDNPLPPGEVGEIVARGPQLMRGYWNLPEATAETMRGGWLHTGDAGSLDEEGYIYIEDRVKDMIVSGGENIYPHEIEQVLFQFPAIADAAVIGVPDEQWGEAVKAIVVLRKDATATAEEIIDFTRGKLAGFKRPRSVDFAASLPYNPSGKVLKRMLREPYWQGHKRRVAGN